MKILTEKVIERLNLIREAILNDIDRFDMLSWFNSNSEETEPIGLKSVCGTTMCIAGWNLALEGYKGLLLNIGATTILDKNDKIVDGSCVMRLSNSIFLALDEESDLSQQRYLKCALQSLYFVSEWPTMVFDEYHDLLAKNKKAEAVNYVFDQFIEADGFQEI